MLEQSRHPNAVAALNLNVFQRCGFDLGYTIPTIIDVPARPSNSVLVWLV
jgi:hypothetical protein